MPLTGTGQFTWCPLTCTMYVYSTSTLSSTFTVLFDSLMINQKGVIVPVTSLWFVKIKGISHFHVEQFHSVWHFLSQFIIVWPSFFFKKHFNLNMCPRQPLEGAPRVSFLCRPQVWINATWWNHQEGHLTVDQKKQKQKLCQTKYK